MDRVISVPTALRASTSAPSGPLFSELVGYGAATTGGKNGDVYEVDSLSDSGSVGTLRHAIDSQSGPRWIVFDPSLSGNINLSNRLVPDSNCTIDGRGSDITLVGGGSAQLYINHVSNVIVTNLKFINDSEEDDSIGIVGSSGYDKYWIHRCSFGIAGDECIGTFRYYDELTFSWNKFENLKDGPGNYEGKGLLIGGQDVYEFSTGDVYPFLTTALTGGETVIDVSYGQNLDTQIGVGQEIGIELDSGIGHWSIVSAVSDTNNTITIEDAVPASTDAAIGNIVAVSRHKDRNIDPTMSENELRYWPAAGYTPITVGYRTRATVHHNYFSTLQRQPRCRNGIHHVYNNYQADWVFGQSVRAGQASQIYYENCVIDPGTGTKTALDWFTADDPVITRGQCKSVGTHRVVQGTAIINDRINHRPERPMFNPNDDYTYTADTADAALESALINETGWRSPVQVSHPGTTAPWDN